ncbi:MAG TPA: glycosyltransferase family 39 protein [Hydrogenophaga sp.]|nr:glycosyltransferase family 39 protein [Hydrogenophaga sp.]
MPIQAETLHHSAHQPPRFRWSWLLALLFVLKALYMGFYVTPPGDIPDESGHYAYARDIARGDIFPIMSKAMIPNNLWFDTGEPQGYLRDNYITQHPPLYYVIAAIPLKITQLFTSDRWFQIRATRTVSAVSLGVLFLALFWTLVDAGISRERSLLLASTLGFIPMVSHLASGITNDIFLFMLCALATRHLVRFVKTQNIRDAYLCAVWLTLAGGTKMTAWVLIAGFVGIMVYELQRPLKSWLVHAAGLTLTALVLPIWWMARNFVHFGNPLKVNLLNIPPKAPDYTLLEYVQNQPFFDWMLVHFYGLIGFSGYCQTPELRHLCAGVRVTRISSQPYEFMVMVLLTITVLFLAHTFLRYRQLAKPVVTALPARSLQQWVANLFKGAAFRTWLLGGLLVAGVGPFLVAELHLYHEPGWVAELARTMMVAAALLGVLGLGVVLLDADPDERLMYYAMVLFLGFGLLILIQGHKAYVLLAELRGVQGRYFYPFLPLMLAAMALLLQRFRVPTVVYLWVVLAMAWGELHAYVTQVIPFFEYVKI